MQNDFAARADWCVLPYPKANHPPVVKLKHPNTLTAKAGSTVQLSASASDPDGNKLSYKWWQYFEVDTYAGKVGVKDHDKGKSSLVVPADAKAGDTIHLIAEVTDFGTPKLTRYQRVIITVN